MATSKRRDKRKKAAAKKPRVKRKAAPAVSPARPVAPLEEQPEEQPKEPPEAALPPLEERAPELIVVGIGASAGGLEAATELLRALEPSPNIALVFVQHLAPKQPSVLPELLARATQLSVESITDGVALEGGRLFVCPPNAFVALEGGRLRLTPRAPDAQFSPVDFFFRSLAENLQSRAIGVVLSGTASDGSVGLRDIKAMGGITIAQKPESAKYDGMPRAAIATGAVDLVETAQGIGRELSELVRHPLGAQLARGRSEALGEMEPVDDQLRRLFAILRKASGIDFTHYKQPTIRRRLQRRMLLQKVTNLDHYLRMLQEDSAEASNLAQDILIHVTHFFRDPGSFAALRETVFPRLMERPDRQSPIRVWLPGCATGEEAYSLGIALLEYLGDEDAGTQIQIFATDVSEPAIAVARAGYYPETIQADVSSERLRKFFSRVDGNYRISKKVRDMCVFARQDLTRDPPFSRLDLILCRNVLIYLNQLLQKKLISVFYYGLRQNAFLMLAGSETVGAGAEYFTLVDKKNKIYMKRSAAPAARMELNHVERAVHPPPRRPEGLERPMQVQAEASRLLISKYAPPGVIVDSEHQVIQFHGRTGLFLEHPPGEPSQNLMKMVREGLLHGVRGALSEVRKTGAAVRRDGLHVRSNGGTHTVTLHVAPLHVSGSTFYLVLFELAHPTALEANGGKEPEERPKRGKKSKPPAPASSEDDAVKRLESELQASREYMQSIIQDLEAANEELQSANEEILSSNEELQSTNEELDTAKEELQSTNEELNTVNDELHARNEELSRVNSDLLNLLGSVEIAIVIVTSDMRIRRFTPMAEKILNLIPGDIGRPITHIKPNINCPDLEQLIIQVVDTVNVLEREVLDRQGNWLLLRIRPYKNLENKIDGAVLALIDVGSSKRAQLDLASARDYPDSIIESIPVPLIVVDAELRVRSVNRAGCEALGFTHAEAIGRRLTDVDPAVWNGSEVEEEVKRVVETGASSSPIPIRRYDGVDKGFMNAQRIEGPAKEALVLLSMESEPEAPVGSRAP